MSLSGRLQLNRYTTGEGKARPPMTCRSDRSPVPPANKRGPERPLGAVSRARAHDRKARNSNASPGAPESARAGDPDSGATDTDPDPREALAAAIWAGNTRRPRQAGAGTAGHPRVGGEHDMHKLPIQPISGSSPRGRGTLCHGSFRESALRVIPAWAGNTTRLLPEYTLCTGHPRVGGEHPSVSAANPARSGSSPRGRGTHRTPPPIGSLNRVIPAWAGNTRRLPDRSADRSGHPRVGGEHQHFRVRPSDKLGSSPRGRGTRREQPAVAKVVRVIPAWAGNTWRRSRTRTSIPGHPRVGGEHYAVASLVWVMIGSSPRGRGTRRGDHRQERNKRVIPAWAGNTLPSLTIGFLTAFWSSPRGRGTRPLSKFVRYRERVIPAWAGNTVATTPYGRGI